MMYDELMIVGVFVGPGPDRPGPKTELGQNCGPRTGPVQIRSRPDWTGLDLGRTKTGPNLDRSSLHPTVYM